MILKGQKTQLRAVEPEDIQLIFEWENNENNWQLSNTLTPFSKHSIKQFVEVEHRGIFENKQLRLMIDAHSIPKTVGSIDLFDFDPFHLRAGVGILINDLSDRQEGYASEGLDLLIEYAKEVLALNQLYCSISPSNKASIQLFESKGFTHTGTQKLWHRTSKHQWEDIYFYQLILEPNA